MATLKDVRVTRDFGEVPSENVKIDYMVWDTELKSGDRYDLLQIAIEEVHGYYWQFSTGLKRNCNQKEIDAAVHIMLSRITEQKIKEYNNFLEDGRKYGWD